MLILSLDFLSSKVIDQEFTTLLSCVCRSFMGVTAHIINKTTLERESYAIACTRFPGTHNYQAIGEMLVKCQNLVGIPKGSDKVVSIVTDNASNFAKVIALFHCIIPYRFCLTH